MELRTGTASPFSPGLAALPHFQTMCFFFQLTKEYPKTPRQSYCSYGDLEKLAIEENQGLTIKPGRKGAKGASAYSMCATSSPPSP
jgi:hypothetical protein